MDFMTFGIWRRRLELLRIELGGGVFISLKSTYFLSQSFVIFLQSLYINFQLFNARKIDTSYDIFKVFAFLFIF